MPFYDPTKWTLYTQKINANTAGQMGASNLRMGYMGAAKSFFDNAPMLMADPAQFKKSSEHVTDVSVFNRLNPQNRVQRSMSATEKGATAKAPVTWKGYTEDFLLSELEFYANTYSKEEALQVYLAQKAKNFYERINADAIQFLQGKASENTDRRYPLFEAYSATGKAKQMKRSNQDFFFPGIATEMAQAKYFGNFNFVADWNLKGIYDFFANQGAQNDVNRAYQLTPFNPEFTVLPPSANANVFGDAFVYADGMVGAYTWINPLHRNGADNGRELWSTFTLPALAGMTTGITVELYEKSEGTDTTAIGVAGGQADLVTQMVMHVDVAFVSAYSQDADTGIYKYSLLTGETVPALTTFAPTTTQAAP